MLIDTQEIDFERLYAENAQALYGFLAYRTGDRELAQDVLAEAFERALRSRGHYDSRKASARTWLYAIALNCLRDRMRRAGSEERALQRVDTRRTGDGHDSAIERVGERDRVRRALAVLSDEEREAVALRYGGAMTVPEIAQLLEQRLTTVEGRVYRALRKLRSELE
jgi:RNA polymerase sigma-70 factor (ECF subfamily)